MRKSDCDHCHSPEPEKVCNLQLLNGLKSRATNSLDTPSQIIQSELQKDEQSSAPYLPTTSAMRMVISRTRSNGIPKLPTTLDVFNVPEKFHHISNWRNIL